MPHYTRDELETHRKVATRGSAGIPEKADFVIVGAGMSGLYVA